MTLPVGSLGLATGSIGPFGPEAVQVGRSEVDQEPGGEKDRLWEATQQLEGVFVQYLMKALRDTVPNQGNADAPGADMYGSLLDEHLSDVIANDTRTGIAEALYRQLTATQPDSSQGGSER